MVQYNEYVAGWLDASIADFLKLLPPSAPSLDYALITCIDSNPDPRSMLETSPELHVLSADARPCGSGLLVPGKLLLDPEVCSRLFFGFDEVWFFPDDNIAPKPPAAWLTGPARVDQSALDRLGQWLSTNSCALGLGDGAGLNFIVKAHGLVKYLLAQSIAQPHFPISSAS